MPHIIVEYTDHLKSSVDIPALVSGLHNDLAKRDTVDVHGIKSRAIPVQFVIVGDGKEPDRMIHITLRLMPGRSDALKKEMAQGLKAASEKYTHHDARITVTVEVVDLHAESYVK
jgi:5-carboxymethyl-2-hydroxymuconate isomerase